MDSRLWQRENCCLHHVIYCNGVTPFSFVSPFPPSRMAVGKMGMWNPGFRLSSSSEFSGFCGLKSDPEVTYVHFVLGNWHEFLGCITNINQHCSQRTRVKGPQKKSMILFLLFLEHFDYSILFHGCYIFFWVRQFKTLLTVSFKRILCLYCECLVPEAGTVKAGKNSSRYLSSM